MRPSSYLSRSLYMVFIYFLYILYMIAYTMYIQTIYKPYTKSEVGIGKVFVVRTIRAESL